MFEQSRWSDAGFMRQTLLTLLALGASFLMPLQGALAQSLSPVWVLSTIAGNGTNAETGNGGPAVNAEIGKPYQAVTDKAGNLYFSTSNSVIRKIDASGNISTVAGTSGTTGYSGDGGAASSALLSAPYGVALDKDGNLLIADEGNSVIRKINLTTGIINTVAGTASKTGYTGDGGPATSATLHTPYTVCTDALGNFYIADYANHVVRKVDVNGTITTFAGTGTSGVTGDGGPAISAAIASPWAVTSDVAGNIYIADYAGDDIRMVDTAGTIHSIAGTAKTAGAIGDGGPALNAEFTTPHNAISDGLGNLYIADEGNHLIRWINAAGIINTIAGIAGKTGHDGDGGPATLGHLDFPYGLTIDSNNNLSIADASNYRLRHLSLNTVLPTTAVGANSTQSLFVQSTVAVTPNAAVVSPATPSEFTVGAPSGCAFGSSLAANTACGLPITFQPTAPGLQTAQLTVTDVSGNLSAIGLSGIGLAPQPNFTLASIQTIVGNGTAGNANSTQVNTPRGGVVDSAGNIYFADSGNNMIRRIDAMSGAITTVAGSGTPGYTGDGSAAIAAQLNAPAKVVVDAAGNLYIADTGNSVIRYVAASTGIIITIAGNGTVGYAGDSGIPTAASFHQPQGLAVDLGGHVYVADTGNNAIRYFGAGGSIVTIAGNGAPGFSGDGGNARVSQLNAPQAVALDQGGNVYIADTGNDVVRKISANNQMSTLAGQQGNAANAGDGGAATAAALTQPSDIALDAAGDLYIAAGGQVRLIDTTGTISTLVGTGASGSYSGDGGAATVAVIPAPISNLMLDSFGNMVLAATAVNRVFKIEAATAMPINFGVQAAGTNSAPTTFALRNTGNSTLSLSAITASAGFMLGSGTSYCSATTTLAPGQSCQLSITFSPGATVNGAVSGTLTLTDNALNAAGATQTFTLSGTTHIVDSTTTIISTSPASLIYGSPATISATIANGSAPTGTVNFTLNGTPLGSAAVSNNQATVTLPVQNAGSLKIGATYSGDSGNNASSATTTIAIQPAVLTVTAVNASMPSGTAVPSLTYSVTGFVNGDASSVVSGAPAETTTATSSSVQGTYPITITQGTLAATNYSFTFLNGTMTVGAPPASDFSLSVSPTTATIPAGNSYTATLTLTPIYGYKGTPQVSCSSAPSGLQCASTGPLAADGSASPHGQGAPAFTQVQIFSPGESLGNKASIQPINAPGYLLAFGIPLGLCGIVFLPRNVSGRAGKLLGLMLLAALVTGMSSCSSSSSSTVLKGTYQVTITATDTAANLSHTTTLSLTLQ